MVNISILLSMKIKTYFYFGAETKILLQRVCLL